MPIDTIIFDIGRVLVEFDHDIAICNIAARCGVTADDIKAMLYTSKLEERYQSGEVTTEDLIATLAEQTGFTFLEDDFVAAASNIFTPKTDTHAIVRTLKQQGYRLQLLSNTSAAHWQFLQENEPILQLFDASTLSFKVKAMKPDPLIYQDALAKAQTDPSRCFYTDDIEDYTAAAKRFGIHTHTFKTAAGLADALQSAGVALT